MTAADICRERGWGKGTLLIGREFGEGWWGESVICITAVGIAGILAYSVGHRSHRNPQWAAEASSECSWTLACRDWKKIDRLPWEVPNNG